MEELSIETNAPTEYGKYVDECLNEAAKHFFSEGKDKYTVADLFYAGIKCKEDWLEKQGKSVLEVWKDMRLEVYQQASGNRHEPNYSDDSTKMFSLTDIDEIFEKVVEKQSKQKSNPYSGVSFEYNGHTWSMCARDGGVDIGYDKQLIANINPIREKDEFDNLSKPIDSKEIGCNTGDFIMVTAPNHGI